MGDKAIRMAVIHFSTGTGPGGFPKTLCGYWPTHTNRKTRHPGTDGSIIYHKHYIAHKIEYVSCEACLESPQAALRLLAITDL